MISAQQEIPIISYIESPTQLLNLIEWAQTSGVQVHYLILNVRSRTSKKTAGHIERLIPFLPVKSIEWIDLEPNLKNLGGIRNHSDRLLDGGLRIKEPVHMVLGEYRSILGWNLINHLACAKVTVLDDGSAMMRIQRNSPWMDLQEFATALFYRSFGIRCSKRGLLEFFSVYPLQKRIAKSDTLTKNHFKWFRSQMKGKKVSDLHFVIGTPLQEAGVTIEDDLPFTIALLRQIKADLPVEAHLVYIPHRRERKEKLAEVSKWMPVKDLGYPFEFYSLFESEYVKNVIGLYSSLFDNLHYIFEKDIHIVSYELNGIKVTKKYKQLLEDSYSNYKNYGFDIRSIDLLP